MEAGILLQVAYCGPAPLPAELMGRWNLDPWLLAAALAFFALSARYVLPERRAPLGVAAFVLFVVFVSPLCALSSALFSARVVHHVLLVAVAAPLLAGAFPKRGDAGLALPLAVSTLTLWLWHAPSLYAAALNDVGLYWVMQLSLLASAVWFWRAVLGAEAALPTALLTLSAAIGQMGLLGALLTFAPSPLYEHHLSAPLAFGLSPLEDQQLGGLIMWVPAMVPYFLIAAWMARRAWSHDLARSTS